MVGKGERSEEVERTLTEKYETERKDSQLKLANASKKVAQAKKLIEQYKKLANEAVDRYIESKALAIGVSASDIKSRLNEGCTFEEIDVILEDMQNYKVNFSQLPINLSKTKSVKVKLTESRETIKPITNNGDEIDDSLLRLAGLD